MYIFLQGAMSSESSVKLYVHIRWDMAVGYHDHHGYQDHTNTMIHIKYDEL